MLQQLDQPSQLGLDRLQLEDLLPRRAVEQPGRGDQVGHLSRIGHGLGGRHHLVRHLGDERHQAAEEIDHRAPQPFDLDAGRHAIRRRRHARDQEGLGGDEIEDPDALQPLHDQAHRAVRGAQELVDDRRGADPVEIVGAGLLRLVAALGHQRQHPVSAHHLVHEPDRARLANRQRHDGVRKDDGAPAQGQHRQRVRDGHAAGRLGLRASLAIGAAAKPPVASASRRPAGFAVSFSGSAIARVAGFRLPFPSSPAGLRASGR